MSRATPTVTAIVGGLTRYGSDTPTGINLADNTNLWGPPPAAAAAIAAAATEAVGYPSLYGEALKDAVARTYAVAPDAVVTGCGSDNVLDATMRAFAGPGRRVVYSAPTFVMLSVFGTLSGATSVAVPFAENGDIDPSALLAADGDVTYICAPNNPTAIAPTPAHVDRVIAEARGLVIIDEAYAEFSGVSWLNRAAESDRVLVARTFSKAYGLAGIRAGFGVASPGLVAAIERARGPYTLNVIAERAAVAALTVDRPWIEERVRDAIASREAFAAALVSRGWAPLPSSANFVCVPMPGAAGVAASLRQQGLRVRAFTALPGVGDALRITVGPWRLMQQLLDALPEAR